MLKNTIEALVFASGKEIPKSEIYYGLKDFHSKQEIDNAIEEVKATYCGECGIILIDVNDKLQFQTNVAYGTLLKELLQETKEREISKTLLQVVAIIAYKQPVTKQEIEELRGGSSADYAVATLIKHDLIQPVGRKEAIGYPILYGTTDEFLKKFGISAVEDLPDYAQIMEDIRNNYEKYYGGSSGLYYDREIDESQTPITNSTNVDVASAIFNGDEDDEELPDFLKDEDIVEVE
ncbi:MAG: SMC-Scp complex subunit ScpB [Bacillota bacterium]